MYKLIVINLENKQHVEHVIEPTFYDILAPALILCAKKHLDTLPVLVEELPAEKVDKDSNANFQAVYKSGL